MQLTKVINPKMFGELLARLPKPPAEGFADDYFKGRKLLEGVEADEHYVGAVPQVDGVLLIFDDGSSAMVLQDGFTEQDYQQTSRLIATGKLPAATTGASQPVN